ncbi:MAG: hypothetical protein FWB72_00030 [Firmicutes bacterium]|nr:hypothetical protein [Bacillota bacterium]
MSKVEGKIETKAKSKAKSKIEHSPSYKLSASSHNLILDLKGRMWAFGGEDYEDIGFYYAGLKPKHLYKEWQFKDVAAGVIHDLAISTDGRLWAFDKESASGGLLVQVLKGEKFMSVSTNSGRTLAIRADGSLLAFGYKFGATEKGITTFNTLMENVSARIVNIKGSKNFSKISVGTSRSLVLDSRGNLFTWEHPGEAYDDEDDEGKPLALKIVPQTIKGLKFKEISAGAAHCLAIDKGGNLWAFGKNRYGELGNGTSVGSEIPILVQKGVKFKKVSAGRVHSLAIDISGNVWAFGYNSSGQIGDGTKDNNRLLPLKVTDKQNFVEVVASNDEFLWKTDTYSLAVESDGSLWGWGSNTCGQLGLGKRTNISNNRLVPTLIKVLSDE